MAIYSQCIGVYLSDIPADSCWGDRALVSYHEQSITIHYQPKSRLVDIQRAARKINNQGITHVKLTGDNWDLDANWQFWLGFRQSKNVAKQSVSWSQLNTNDEQALKHRLAVIDWVRDTINMPAEELSPFDLAINSASFIQSFAPNAVTFTLISGEELKEKSHMGLYTVGKGSQRPPVLLELDYNPTHDPKSPITACLVGKGITFDSGGYSLKPTNFMEAMRSDMGGAALMAGSLALAITQGLTQRIKLYLCCADNLVSGNAFKLGDIIRYRNGTCVEITNTDAEGRLVLADGLLCACDDKPKYIIDCATLTGAAKIAVGNDYHALLSFDDQFADLLLKSADHENEPFWRLPLAEFHRGQIPSSFADLNNSGMPNTAGASTAAAFLSHFVDNYHKNWLHIDCSATFQKSATAMWATGATGIGVKTLAHLLTCLNGDDVNCGAVNHKK